MTDLQVEMQTESAPTPMALWKWEGLCCDWETEIPSELTVHLNPHEAHALEDFITETKDLSVFTTSERGLWTFFTWVLVEAQSFKLEMHDWVLRSGTLQTIREAAMQQQQAPQLVGIVLAAISYYRLLGIPQPVKNRSSTSVCDCQVCAFDGLLRSNCTIRADILNDVVFALQKAMVENIESEEEQLYFHKVMVGYQMRSCLPEPNSRSPRHASGLRATHRVSAPRIGSPRYVSGLRTTYQVSAPRIGSPRHASGFRAKMNVPKDHP
ncbi:hypothetical protein LZ30DRAFT_694031 [Colletotrichum cereale]|nr:hypothetical protein LZ30DRAFT_694031 [Colletotrichum cereale]